MAHLNARLANFYIQWPDDATRTLIECRRVAQPNFCSTPIHSQKRLWRSSPETLTTLTLSLLQLEDSVGTSGMR